MKTLRSGIEVDDKEYYQLLEWKDEHPVEFRNFISKHTRIGLVNHMFSINKMSSNTYQNLLRYSKLHK